MKKMFFLPVLAAVAMAGCSSAPKHPESVCEQGEAVTEGSSMLQAGYWKAEDGNIYDCETKVMVAADTAATMNAKRVRLDARILFDFDSAWLTDGGRVELDLLVNDISEMAMVEQIMVIGHTDSVGSKSYNQMLSERRAASVRDHLALRLAEVDIRAEGRGEEEPVADNATAEGRAKNRRVEVIVDGSMEAKMRELKAPVVDKMTETVDRLTK